MRTAPDEGWRAAFVGVLRRQHLQLDLYPTWTRMIARLGGGSTNAVVLRPGKRPTGDWKSFVELGDENKGWYTKTLPLGLPVVQLRLHELASGEADTKARVDESRGVLRRWIEFDKANIANAEAKIHYITSAHVHETDEPPRPFERIAFANCVNIPTTQQTFRDAAAALLLEYQHEDPNRSWSENVRHLCSLLESVSHEPPRRAACPSSSG